MMVNGVWQVRSRNLEPQKLILETKSYFHDYSTHMSSVPPDRTKTVLCYQALLCD